MKKVFNFILVAIIFMNSILYFSYSDSTDNQYWRSFIYDKQAWGLGAVNRLASHGDKLFVSGYFGYRFYDTVCFNGIAELSNNAWLPMGTGEYAGVRGSWLTTINDMIIKDSMLYVVGSFDTAGAISAKNIAKWNINSRTWSSVGKGTNGIITSIVRLNNKLFIGGRFDTLYTSNDTIIGHNIAAWDGTNWVNLDNGINGPVNCMYAVGNELYVVGEFDSVDNIYAKNVGIWNDSTNQWSSFGMNGPKGDIFSVCKLDNILYLGGYFDSVNTNSGPIYAKNLVRWDGTTWTSFGNGIDGHIHRMKTRDTNLLLVGSFEKIKNDSDFCKNIVRWDGSDWQFFGSGTNEFIRDIEFWGDSILVGGSFYFTGDTLAEFIGLWYTEPDPNFSKLQNDISMNESVIVKNYPNPGKERIEIDFFIDSKSKVTISAYDINGNKRENILEAIFNKGWNKAYWKTSKVENGSYIIEVKSEKSKVSSKVIINR